MKPNYLWFQTAFFSALILAWQCLPLQAEDEATADYNKGSVSFSKRDWYAAIDGFTQAIELNPKLMEAYYYRANAEEMMGEYDEAIADFSKVIDINPEYAEAFEGRGQAKTSKSDFEGAIADLTQAIKINPQFAKALFDRGVAKWNKNDWDGAINDLNQTVEINPQLVGAYYYRASAKEQKGDLNGALADCNTCMEMMAPPNFADYDLRANIRYKMGDIDGYHQDYDKAHALLSALPNSPTTKSAPSSEPQSNGGVSLGTGFFVTPNGYLLTDFHVVKDASSISVKVGENMVPAKLVAQDAVNDVAILKVEGSFTCLPLGDSNNVSLGQNVFTVGFPDPDLQGLSPKLTKGEISSIVGMQDDPRMFQISVPVQPGSSGGSLVDDSGNVVGLIEASLSTLATAEHTGDLLQNVNYATKVTYAKALLDSVPDAESGLPPIKTIHTSFADEVKLVQGATVFIIAGSNSSPLPATHLYTDSAGNTYSVSDVDYQRLHPQKVALDAENTKLDQLDAEFETQARRIEQDRQSLDNTDSQAINAFNAEVDRHNSFGDAIQQEMDAFNDAVDKFNAELKRVGTLVK